MALAGSSALKLENNQLRAELERLKRRLHRTTSEAGSIAGSSSVVGLGAGGPALEQLTSDLAQVSAGQQPQACDIDHCTAFGPCSARGITPSNL